MSDCSDCDRLGAEARSGARLEFIQESRPVCLDGIPGE